MEIFRKYFIDNRVNFDDSPDWGIKVRTVGHYIHAPRTKYPDNDHPDSYYFDWEQGRSLQGFHLIYIPNGEGLLETKETGVMRIESGSTFLLYPGIWHRYRPSRESGWEEFWIGFDGNYANHLMAQRCFNPSSPLIKTSFNTELLTIFMKLIETVKYEGVAYQQFSSCMVSQLLAIVYASALNKNEARQNNLLHKAKFIMVENINKNLRMEALAQELGVNYHDFRKSFKKTAGLSPGKYFLNLRIERSCSLLKETDLSISEIAFHLGFESEFYFSRIFKKRIGLPPGVFRNSATILKSEPVI